MSLTREQVINFVKACQKLNYSVGYTSGCFDILHAGHVEFLQKVKCRCQVLIVGLNSDSSVKKLKGDNRPINNVLNREKVLNTIVDAVFIFDEENNNKNIQLIKPDIYFKAGDYDKSKLTSAKYVEEYGGRVEIIPIETNTSTTKIINKIRGIK